MAWKAGTGISSKVKMKRARWASLMVKPVETALCLVYFVVCCSVIFLRPMGYFVRDITLL
jgi:hypothetical protein